MVSLKPALEILLRLVTCKGFNVFNLPCGSVPLYFRVIIGLPNFDISISLGPFNCALLITSFSSSSSLSSCSGVGFGIYSSSGVGILLPLYISPCSSLSSLSSSSCTGFGIYSSLGVGILSPSYI